MNESVRGRARRVLVVGASAELPSEDALAADGVLIVMESDAARVREMRRAFAGDGLGTRATVISGDPRRMLYKLAGPFDVIVCSRAHVGLRPMLEKLLAPDGAIITHDEC